MCLGFQGVLFFGISGSVCECFVFLVSVCFSVRCSLVLGFWVRGSVRCFCGCFDPRFGSVLVCGFWVFGFAVRSLGVLVLLLF